MIFIQVNFTYFQNTVFPNLYSYIYFM